MGKQAGNKKQNWFHSTHSSRHTCPSFPLTLWIDYSYWMTALLLLPCIIDIQILNSHLLTVQLVSLLVRVSRFFSRVVLLFIVAKETLDSKYACPWKTSWVYLFCWWSARSLIYGTYDPSSTPEYGQVTILALSPGSSNCSATHQGESSGRTSGLNLAILATFFNLFTCCVIVHNFSGLTEKTGSAMHPEYQTNHEEFFLSQYLSPNWVGKSKRLERLDVRDGSVCIMLS